MRGSAKAPRLWLRSLEDQVRPLDVHPGPLVDPNGAGRVLGVDSETDRLESATRELGERVAQQRLSEPQVAVLGQDAKDADPAEPRPGVRRRRSKAPYQPVRRQPSFRLEAKPWRSRIVRSAPPAGTMSS